MSIYYNTLSDKEQQNFTPTFLYVKQHKITGLKYFGKTTQTNPIKYRGSGLYWTRHLKVYGNTVDTLWIKLFTDKQSLIEYATKFSIDNNIVESAEWANMRIENGIDGNPKNSSYVSRPLSEEHKSKISKSLTGIKRSAETLIKMSNASKGNSHHKGNKHSEESKKKMSLANKGKKHSESTIQKMKEAHAKRRAARAALT